MLMVVVLACTLAQSPPPPPPPPKKEEPKPKRLERIRVGSAVAQASKETTSWTNEREFESAEVSGVLEGLRRDQLAPVVSGSWEEQVLEAARKSVGAIVHSSLGEPTGLYTFSTSIGDVLVARWSGFSGTMPTRDVWIWDEPWYAKLVLEIDPVLFDDQDLMLSYCRDLFVRSGKTMPPPLKWRQSVDDRMWLSGGIAEDETHQLKVWASHWLFGVNDGSKAFVVIGVSKNHSISFFPPGARLVMERFPPLRDRAKLYSKTMLISELGKGQRPGRKYLASSTEVRDEVLINELLSGDSLTEADLRAILAGPDDPRSESLGWRIEFRFNALRRVINARGQNSEYAPALTRLIVNGPIPGAQREAQADGLLRFWEQSRLDATAFAAAFVKNRISVERSLSYLEGHATNFQVIREIDGVDLGSELEPRKLALISKLRELDRQREQ